MKRSKSRFLSLLLMTCLVISMVPVGPASGALLEGSAAQSAATGPRVFAQMNHGEVDIEVVGQNGTEFDVFRSGSALVEGTKLNDAPVAGKRFTDADAEAGASYCYTVKSGGKLVGTVLIDVPAAKVVEPRAAVEGSSGKMAVVGAVGAPIEVSPIPDSAVEGMTTIETSTGVTVLGNTTWSPAGGPYFVRNDVVVPAGKTLTILPGTKVYFDVAASGVDSDYPSPAAESVTGDIDLVVHGKLVANGSSASPIVLSSIYSFVDSATADSVLPEANDWGAIFFDNKTAASSISYSQIEFASFAVWSFKTSYPAVKNNVFRDVYASGRPWAAVAFIAPPTQSLTVPRVTVTGNTMLLPDSGSEGVAVYAESYGTGADAIVDPLISGNNITASYPIDLEAWEESGDSHGNLKIRGSVTGNTLVSTEGNAVYVWANVDTRTAEFTTAFSNNLIKSDGSEAVWVQMSADSSGSVVATPKFTGDKITSTSDHGLFFDIDTGASSVPGKATAKCSPVFISCDTRSAGGDGIEIAVDSGKNTPAIADPVFSGGYLQSTSDNGCDIWASSGENAAASASPSFTNVTGRTLSSTNEVVYCDVRAAGTGLAKANPKWIGGSASATYSDAIHAYAQSSAGPAEASPWIESTTLRGYHCGVDAEAYACYDASGTAAAKASPTLLNSSVYAASYDALYSYANNNADGDAISSPTIKNCTLDSNTQSGLEVDAYAYGYGAAVASPVITDSTLVGYDRALCIDAYRSGEETKSAAVTCSPKITRSKITGTYYEAASIDAENSGTGACVIKPVIDASTFNAAYYDNDEAMYLNAEAYDGNAEIAPTATGSTFNGAYGGYEANAYSYGDERGAAKVGGSFTNCSFRGTWDDAYYGYADCAFGTSEANPTFTGCTMVCQDYDDYGAYIEAYSGDSSATAVTASPVFSGGKVISSGYGVKVHSRAYASGNLATSTAAPKFLNSSVYSGYDEYALSLLANSEGNGTVYNNSYIYNTTVFGAGGAIQLHANAGNSAANCYNNAKVLGASSTNKMKVDGADENGIRILAVTSTGNAYNNSEVRNVDVSSHGHGLFTRAYVKGGSGKVAVNKAIAASNRFNAQWGTCDGSEGPSGIQMTCTTNSSDCTSTCMPTITGNSIVGAHEDGIEVSACSSTGILKPTISGNSIFGTSIYGIYLWDGSDSTMSAPVVSKNTIVRTGDAGMYLDCSGGMVTQNKVLQPGVYSTSNQPSYTSCLYWSDPDPTLATVKGNLLVGSPSSALYFDSGAATVQYNSFTDAAGNANRPFNYWTDQNATVSAPPYATPFNAQYNWWGVASAEVSKTVNTPSYAAGFKTDIVDYSNALPTRQPKVTKIVVSKTSTKVKLTVTFDRPMDTAVKKLYFGKSSPYKTYNATGTWNTAGTVWTATRSKAGLPTGVKLYFTGALDLPGNTMLSTSKYFKL